MNNLFCKSYNNFSPWDYKDARNGFSASLLPPSSLINNLLASALSGNYSYNLFGQQGCQNTPMFKIRSGYGYLMKTSLMRIIIFGLLAKDLFYLSKSKSK